MKSFVFIVFVALLASSSLATACRPGAKRSETTATDSTAVTAAVIAGMTDPHEQVTAIQSAYQSILNVADNLNDGQQRGALCCKAFTKTDGDPSDPMTIKSDYSFIYACIEADPEPLLIIKSSNGGGFRFYDEWFFIDGQLAYVNSSNSLSDIERELYIDCNGRTIRYTEDGVPKTGSDTDDICKELEKHARETVELFRLHVYNRAK